MIHKKSTVDYKKLVLYLSLYLWTEFGLFNIVCEGEIKVAVENNQFPDGTMNMNVFDLALIDSFQVQITKDEFKTKPIEKPINTPGDITMNLNNYKW